MSEPMQDTTGLPVSASMAQLRRRQGEATQALLGSTIAISDEDWQRPSLLPGWTRAHVATHLARNADALARVAIALLNQTPAKMYGSEAERMAELERGSLHTPLELQIDLDTSAEELNKAFNAVEDSGLADEVELAAGMRMPVTWLPVARLDEVVLHHIDLDCGFTIADVEADIARWLLEWNCLKVGERPDFPALHVHSTSGLSARIGDPTLWPREVHGTDTALLGWLTSRGEADMVHGSEGLALPHL